MDLTPDGPDKGGGLTRPHLPSGDTYVATRGGGVGGADCTASAATSASESNQEENGIMSGASSAIIAEQPSMTQAPIDLQRPLTAAREEENEEAPDSDPSFDLTPNSIRLLFDFSSISLKVQDVINALEIQGGPDLSKKIEGVLHKRNSFMFLFSRAYASHVPSLLGKTVRVGDATACVEDGNSRQALSNSAKSNEGNPRYKTTVTFRVLGLPLVVNPHELLVQLNRLGFELKSISDMAQVYHPELQKLKIKTEIVEVRQSCLKEEESKFQKLFGVHKVTLKGSNYKVRLFRPGHCFHCQKRGHLARDCEAAKIVKKARSETITCWTCNQVGHSRPQCPVFLKKVADFDSRRAARSSPFSEEKPESGKNQEFLNCAKNDSNFPVLITNVSLITASSSPFSIPKAVADKKSTRTSRRSSVVRQKSLSENVISSDAESSSVSISSTSAQFSSKVSKPQKQTKRSAEDALSPPIGNKGKAKNNRSSKARSKSTVTSQSDSHDSDQEMNQ